jgi:hypothetical protein
LDLQARKEEAVEIVSLIAWYKRLNKDQPRQHLRIQTSL